MFRTIMIKSIYFFFFNDTATTEIYTLSLHDALPICLGNIQVLLQCRRDEARHLRIAKGDRKSTRLNSSHGYISYAVFCLKKKKSTPTSTRTYTLPSFRAPTSRPPLPV